MALRQQASLLGNQQPRQIQSLQSGSYLSRFRGRGSEFDEVRPYQAGDDTRDIDWRVSARTGRTYTKQYREERECPVLIALDLRRPMFFGTRQRFKSTLAIHLAGLLGWWAEQRGDRIGVTLFNEQQHHECRPRRGQKAMLHLIQLLIQHQLPDTSQATASLSDAVLRLIRISKTGTRIYLISDFHDLDDQTLSRLQQLVRHNELVCLFVHDPLESDLPGHGHYTISDGQHRLALSCNDSLQQHFKQQFSQRQQRLQELARNRNIQLLELRTDQDPLAVLRRALR